MVHAALLLLMLEAVTTDLVFTISLKRSTQNLQLSTSWAGRLHHLSGEERTSSAPSEPLPVLTHRHWLCRSFWKHRLLVRQPAIVDIEVWIE